ncbi:MAG: ABC transporter permease, partial [Anaerolineales bacterium]|nr:ABC transporter permease [Anaerolineales bacterium]
GSNGLQVEQLADGGTRLTLTPLEQPVLNQLIDHLRQAGIEIQSIQRPEWGLDQIFGHLTKETLPNPDPALQSGRSKLPPVSARDPLSKPRATGVRTMLRVALAFLRRDLRMEASYRLSFFLQFFNIFFSVAVFYFIAQLLGPAALPYLQAYGGDYFSFVLIGIAFAGYFNVGLSSFANSLRTAQTTGTLEAMLSTPTRLSTIILSSSQWSYFMTTVRVLVYLAVGSLLLGVNLENSNLFWSVCILLLTVVTFSSLGILAASFIMVLKRGDPVTWLFGTFSALLGGVYYPVEIMPAWLQWLSAFLPITYALRAMRLALLQGAGWQTLQLDLFVLAFFAVILLPLSLAAFRYAVRRARQDGSLAHY